MTFSGCTLGIAKGKASDSASAFPENENGGKHYLANLLLSKIYQFYINYKKLQFNRNIENQGKCSRALTQEKPAGQNYS